VDDQEKKDMAAAIAAAIASANAGSADTARAVAFTEMKGKIERLQEEVADLEKHRKENDAVLLWARSFMDNYKKVMMVVVTSGVLTTIGLLFQLYYMVNKGK
jgi:hypothetical protein